MVEPFLFTRLPHADRLRTYAIKLRQQSTGTIPVSGSPSLWLTSLRGRSADASRSCARPSRGVTEIRAKGAMG